MNCPYKSHGYVDKCIGGCKPLEKIYGYSGLSPEDAKHSSGNVLGAYVSIKLDDVVRDSPRILERLIARVGRRLIGTILPRELDTYLQTVNQAISKSEKSNSTLEKHLFSVGEIGSNIFTLSAPSYRQYNKEFIKEAGKNTSLTMTMDDMITDLSKDKVSGAYNPLKIGSDVFITMYQQAMRKLGDIMRTINITKSSSKNIYMANFMIQATGFTAIDSCLNDIKNCIDCFNPSSSNCYVKWFEPCYNLSSPTFILKPNMLELIFYLILAYACCSCICGCCDGDGGGGGGGG